MLLLMFILYMGNVQGNMRCDGGRTLVTIMNENYSDVWDRYVCPPEEEVESLRITQKVAVMYL